MDSLCEQFEKKVDIKEGVPNVEKYSLIENTKSNSQLRLIAEFFEKNIGKDISKRELEKLYGLKVSCSTIDFRNINSIDDLIKASKNLPGDLQRNIRTFYDKFEKYGLTKKGKGKTLKYSWNPVNANEDFVKKCPRNLFKNIEERFDFCQSKNNKCELCEKSCDRMAIDHWRAHSVYKIDNIDIAVLLCEQCNNIHHNFDAVKVAKKHNRDINIIKNWVKIESRIQTAGYEPNENDKKEQLKTIQYINDKYHKKIGSYISDEFWNGLNKVINK